MQQRLLTTLQPLFSSNPPPSSASSPLALLHDLLVPASLRREEPSPLAGAIPAAATTAACVLLVFLAVLASAMASSSPTSWASRFGAWSGRFSPFGRASTAARAGEVGEGDYSYITGEDIARTAADGGGGGGGAARPERETDALLLKHRSVSYPVHVPAYSVDDGELTVGKVRAAAAKKLGLPEAEAARVKLFYRGRNLKDDARAARAEGLRSADQPEILVVVGTAAQAAAQQAQRPPVRGAEEIEDDDDDDEGDDDGEDADGKPGRKKRNRKKNSKRSKNAAPAPVAPPIAPSSSSGGVAAPQTAVQKLDAITSTFRATILPACERFLASPPPEGERRAAEHRRLTETVLAQVLLKLDAVETEGDEEARGRRKELVREAQGLLGRLDGLVG